MVLWQSFLGSLVAWIGFILYSLSLFSFGGGIEQMTGRVVNGCLNSQFLMGLVEGLLPNVMSWENLRVILTREKKRWFCCILPCIEGSQASGVIWQRVLWFSWGAEGKVSSVRMDSLPASWNYPLVYNSNIIFEGCSGLLKIHVGWSAYVFLLLVTCPY